METMREEDFEEQYNELLDELYPLEGIACNCFSTLLKAGDNIAYRTGLLDYADSQDIEIV